MKMKQRYLFFSVLIISVLMLVSGCGKEEESADLSENVDGENFITEAEYYNGMEQSNSIDAESDGYSEINKLVNELYDMDNYGSEEWFEECDALWQRLRAKELSYTALELDSFYQVYYIPASYIGCTDKIAVGLETYIELTLELIQDSMEAGENEMVVTDINTNLMETLAATQEYDEIIIRTFRDMVDLNMGSATEMPEDTDDVIAMLNAESMDYSTRYAEAWAESLEGNGLWAMSSFAKYCAGNMDMGTEPAALASLYSGDFESAASAVNNWIVYCVQTYSAEDIPFLEECLMSYLLNSESLVWRGEIDALVFDKYLREIDADFGIEVKEVTPEAQHAGMMPGDIIIGVDAQRIAGVQHFLRLRNQEREQFFEILRNGEIILLTISGPVEFYGDMAVRF